jgi:hypothetical protein
MTRWIQMQLQHKATPLLYKMMQTVKNPMTNNSHRSKNLMKKRNLKKNPKRNRIPIQPLPKSKPSQGMPK